MKTVTYLEFKGLVLSGRFKIISSMSCGNGEYDYQGILDGKSATLHVLAKQ